MRAHLAASRKPARGPEQAAKCVYALTSAERRRLCFHLCWFFVFYQIIMEKTRQRIFMKFSGKVRLGTRNNVEQFRDVPLNPLYTFRHFRGNPCLLATLRKN